MKIQYETELYHHGIKGQRWGVRRFQNLDGTRTALGRKRYGEEVAREYNKLARKNARDNYYRNKYEKAYVSSHLASKTKLMQKIKPLGKLNEKIGESYKKAYLPLAEETAKQRKLMDETISKMSSEGYNYDFKKAKTVVDGSLIVTPAFVYANVVRAAYGKIKFTDPTQPKTREERRAEKDLNRVKNAAYEENQSAQRLREATINAERTVGTRPVKGYRLQREWNDPEHEDVKKAKQAERSWMRSQERFADEYDRYKKQHPGTDKSLRDFAKMRERNMYPVKKKYRT